MKKRKEKIETIKQIETSSGKNNHNLYKTDSLRISEGLRLSGTYTFDLLFSIGASRPMGA